jgi:large subunit ribosomal protein L24
MKRIKVGDLVQVISGKDKGKQGRITRVLSDVDKVIVEGLNQVVRHTRPSPRNQEGGKITKEAQIPACKVMPVDPTTSKPTRVRTQKAEDGTKTRVAKSGAAITVS